MDNMNSQIKSETAVNDSRLNQSSFDNCLMKSFNHTAKPSNLSYDHSKMVDMSMT